MRTICCNFLFLILCCLSLSTSALAQIEIIVPFPEPGQTVILEIPAKSNLILSAEISALCVPSADGFNLVYNCTLDEEQNDPGKARAIILQGLLALPREQMPSFTLLDSQ